MAPGVEEKKDARVLGATWIVLVGLTLGSFWLARSSPTTGAAAWVLGVAALKGHLIAGIFMEMRRGPRVWAAAMSLFLLAEAAVIFLVLP